MPGTPTISTLWRPLVRHLLAPEPDETGHAPACGLGIDGLPQGLDRLPLGTPVALAWQDGAADAQWVQALLRDLLQSGPLMLLAEQVQVIEPWLQQPDLAQAFAQGRLKICLMTEPLLAAQRPQGMPPVFDELARAGLDATHALLVLAAPGVHLGRSVAEVQQWGRQIGRWCRRRNRPVVLAFRHWDSALQVISPLHSLADVFEHVALLGSEAAQPMLYVERWNASTGPLFEARFGLKAEGQRLAYNGSQRSGPLQRLVEAPDQYRLITTSAVLAGPRGAPAQWQVLAQLEDVLDASQDALAATLLLDGGDTAQFEALLHLVHTLRKRHGRSLKIVVRETQDKLRSHMEQALLSLGANTVVYREVGFARLLRQLEELSDATFTRPLLPDFAQARAGYMPDALRGYLKPEVFCDTVQAMLERTRQLGLRHSFLRLSMHPQVAHADAIQACVTLRDGDVLTADHDALYVFLFACDQSDIDPALTRLFSAPPAELFATQALYASRDGMRVALQVIHEAARQGAPDYSSFRSTSTATAKRSMPPALAAPPLPLQGAPTVAFAETVLTPLVQAHPLARRNPPPTQGKTDAN